MSVYVCLCLPIIHNLSSESSLFWLAASVLMWCSSGINPQTPDDLQQTVYIPSETANRGPFALA